MKVCNMDCFNCVYDDCINDKVRPLEKRDQERNNKHQRDRYYRLKAQGLCIRCGKKNADHGVYCYECYIGQKRYVSKKEKNMVREHRQENGLCYFCEEKRVQGKKVCERHLKVFVKTAEHARQFSGRRRRWTT